MYKNYRPMNIWHLKLRNFLDDDDENEENLLHNFRV